VFRSGRLNKVDSELGNATASPIAAHNIVVSKNDEQQQAQVAAVQSLEDSDSRYLIRAGIHTHRFAIQRHIEHPFTCAGNTVSRTKQRNLRRNSIRFRIAPAQWQKMSLECPKWISSNNPTQVSDPQKHADAHGSLLNARFKRNERIGCVKSIKHVALLIRALNCTENDRAHDFEPPSSESSSFISNRDWQPITKSHTRRRQRPLK
jgi:hypothetical protein